MKLCILDFETTGLDPAKDRAIELGAALWDSERRSILHTFSVFLRPEPCVVPPEITAITGITAADLQRFGRPHAEGLKAFAEWLVAGEADRLGSHTMFDRDFLTAELKRCVNAEAWWEESLVCGWVDTSIDLPFATTPDSRKLKYLAADHGFINPMPHRALSDAITATLLLSHYPIDEVLARADSPAVLVQSLQPFEANDRAKALGFVWDRVIKRAWAQQAKECDLPAILKGAEASGFKVRRLAA